MSIFNFLSGKKLSNSYKIDKVMGLSFIYHGVPSFIMTAIPEGKTAPEHFVLPHSLMWSEIAMLHNNHISWHPVDINLEWSSVDIEDIKGSFMDCKKAWVQK